MGAGSSSFLREKLKELIVDPSSVVETGENLGTGSYGEVVVVKVNGLRCACKKLHEMLTGSVTRENRVVVRFVEECQTMSKLHHPHIVQFLGVHFGQSPTPYLIMELLPINLGNFLEKYKNVPSYVKHSALFDVSLGLLYLHQYKPPIIHRDLTVNNILLTHSLKAKIADLGVARTLNVTYTQRRSPDMSVCPGTQSVMPPEAFEDHPQYDAKLDIFSFGHIVVHVAIQKWPLPLDEKYTDPVTNEELHRTEIERREEYISEMGSDNSLYNLAVSCLQNDPAQRPTTDEVVDKMEHIYTKTPPPYSDLMEAIQEIHDLSTRVKDLNCQIEKLKVQLAAAGRPTVEMPEKGVSSQPIQFPSQTTPPISKSVVTPEKEAPTTPLQIANHEPSPPIPKPRATTPERGALTTPLQIANHEPSPAIPEPRPLATTPEREVSVHLLPTSNHEPSPPIPEPRSLETTPEREVPAHLLPTSNHEPSPPIPEPRSLETTPEREVPAHLLPTSNHEPSPPIPEPRSLETTPQREVPAQLLLTSNHEPSPPIPEPRPLTTTPERVVPAQLLPTSNHEPSPPIPKPGRLATTLQREMPAQLLPTPPIPKPRTRIPEREVFAQPAQPTQISNREPTPRARLGTAPASSNQHQTSRSKNEARLVRKNSLLLGERRDPKFQELLDKQKKKIQDNESGESFRKLETTQRNKYTYESHTLPRLRSAGGRQPTAELQQLLEKRRSKIGDL